MSEEKEETIDLSSSEGFSEIENKKEKVTPIKRDGEETDILEDQKTKDFLNNYTQVGLNVADSIRVSAEQKMKDHDYNIKKYKEELKHLKNKKRFYKKNQDIYKDKELIDLTIEQIKNTKKLIKNEKKIKKSEKKLRDIAKKGLDGINNYIKFTKMDETKRKFISYTILFFAYLFATVLAASLTHSILEIFYF